MADNEEAVPLPEEISAPAEEAKVAETKSVEQKQLDRPKYHIRPDFGERLQGENIREIIITTMREQLLGRQYKMDDAARWVKTITNNVRLRVQQLGHQRYKIIVQSFLMEMKGAGVKCAQRCVWDPETDSHVADSYRNESMMCHTTVYGVYLY